DQAPDFGALAAPVDGQSPHAGAGLAATQADAQPEAGQAGTTATPGKPRNSLMAWRLPLFNPDRWLRAATPWAHRIFSPAGLLLWLLAMLALLVGMVLHAPALHTHASTWMHTPRYLLIAALCYPVMKALHEAAHALAVRRWGGTVHEAGITLMMLMPVPYVDASAA